MIINKLALIGLISFAVQTTPNLEIEPISFTWSGYLAGPTDHPIAIYENEIKLTLNNEELDLIINKYPNNTLGFYFQIGDFLTNNESINFEFTYKQLNGNPEEIKEQKNITYEIYKNPITKDNWLYVSTGTTFERMRNVWSEIEYIRFITRIDMGQKNAVESRLIYELNIGQNYLISTEDILEQDKDYTKIYMEGFEAGKEAGKIKGYEEAEKDYLEVIDNIKEDYQKIIDNIKKDYQEIIDSLQYQILNGTPLMNFFELLKKGADSLGGILNIVVFPGITIGTLVAIPIIIALVGFILKFIT